MAEFARGRLGADGTREMTVGTCKVELQIPANRSLKEKRRVVKSLKDRVQGRFNVSIAEVEIGRAHV